MSHTATADIPTTDRAQQAIGQIAVNLPGSTAVFRRLKLDFCCGGQVPLQQACNSKGLPLDAVLAELASLERSSHRSARGDDRTHPDPLPRGAPRAAAGVDPHGPAC